MTESVESKKCYTSKCNVDNCDIMVSTVATDEDKTGPYDHFRKINGLLELHTQKDHPEVEKPDMSFGDKTRIIYSWGGKRKRSAEVILFLKAFL